MASAGPLLPLLVLGREPAGQLALSRGLGRATPGCERRAEQEMRVAVRRIAADGLAQPADRGLRFARQPVGVPQIEEIVGVARIRLDRLVEVEARQSRLRRRPPADLDDAEVVPRRGGRLCVRDRFEAGERLVILVQIEMGERRQEPGAARPGRIRGDRQHRLQRLRMIALIGVDVPERQPRTVEGRLCRQRLVEIADRGRGDFRQQPLDVALERRERRVRPLDLPGGRRTAQAGARSDRRSRTPAEPARARSRRDRCGRSRWQWRARVPPACRLRGAARR